MKFIGYAMFFLMLLTDFVPENFKVLAGKDVLNYPFIS